MDYDFGQKRNWRRWLWNRISERAKMEGLILYLPSREDLDRDLALARGFKNGNLIGVERDASALTALRRSGVLAIHGDIFDAALSLLSSGKKISVVNADLTRGLAIRDGARIIDLLTHPKSVGMTIAVNLQRGRDPEINPHRDIFPALFKLWKLKATDPSSEFNPKHRGMQLFLGTIANIAASWFKEIEVEQVQQLIKSTRCAFHSYRSTKLATFDSVVFNNPFSDWFYEQRCLSEDDVNSVLKKELPKNTRLSSSAVMATAKRIQSQ